MGILPEEREIKSIAATDFNDMNTGLHVKTYFRNNTRSTVFVCDLDGNTLYTIPSENDSAYYRPHSRTVTIETVGFVKPVKKLLENIPTKIYEYKITESQLSENFIYIKRLQCIICTVYTKPKIEDKFMLLKHARDYLMNPVVPILRYAIIGNFPENLYRGYILDHNDTIEEVVIIKQYENIGLDVGDFRLYYSVSSLEDINTLEANTYYLQGNINDKTSFNFNIKDDKNFMTKNIVLSFDKDYLRILSARRKEHLQKDDTFKINQPYIENIISDRLNAKEEEYQRVLKEKDEEIKKYKERIDLMTGYSDKLRNDNKYLKKTLESSAEETNTTSTHKLKTEKLKAKTVFVKTVIDLVKVVVSTIIIAKIPIRKIFAGFKSLFVKTAIA